MAEPSSSTDTFRSPYSDRTYSRARKGLDCNCCGAPDEGEPQGEAIEVWRFASVDVDDVYFARLCTPCLFDVEHGLAASGAKPSLAADAAAAFGEIMPGEEADGIPAMLEDMGLAEWSR